MTTLSRRIENLERRASDGEEAERLLVTIMLDDGGGGPPDRLEVWTPRGQLFDGTWPEYLIWCKQSGEIPVSYEDSVKLRWPEELPGYEEVGDGPQIARG